MARAEREATNPRTVGRLAFGAMFVIGTDTFLVAPLLPELRAQFGIGIALSGWLVSAYSLGYALCALIAGPISDRGDRRRMLIAGMIGFTVCTAACGLTGDFWSLAALRFLAGVAAGIAAPQVWAAIPQLVPGDVLVRTMGQATAGLAIAQLAGIPLGSFLASVSWRFAFFAVGVLAAIVTALLMLRFPAVPRTDPSGSRGYRAVRAVPGLVRALVAYLVFQTGNFAALSFYGTWFSRDFGLGAVGIGAAMVVIGAGNAAGSVLGHRLVARWGIRRSLLVGILAMLIGYLMIAFVDVLVPAVTILTVVMFAAGFVFPVLMTVLQSRAGAARGTVSSLANVAMYGGATLGVAIAGPVFAATPGFLGVAAIAVTSSAASLLLFRKAGNTGLPRS